MDFDFDAVIDRRRTNCTKWDMMERYFGASSENDLAMWVADMDFLPPPAVNATLQKMIDHGIHGYFGDDTAYRSASVNWMDQRHDWRVEPDAISTVNGLVHGIGLCLDAYTAPDDEIIIFTPVYHAFSARIQACGRKVVEAPLVLRDGMFHLDLETLESRLSGRERMLIFCSPHNPGGRVWSVAEFASIAHFCERHDLILLSDEVHHDLVFEGFSHTPMVNAAPKQIDRIVMLSAASKTFNLAGGETGQVIIPNADLRHKFEASNKAFGSTPNRFGPMMSTAAYAHGAPWLDALLRYLDGNRAAVEDGLNEIPGVSVMPMGATYLSWIEFSGTGMNQDEIRERVQNRAGVVCNYGPTFGTGGETCLRLNFATPRSRVAEAVTRIQDAFSDLQ